MFFILFAIHLHKFSQKKLLDANCNSLHFYFIINITLKLLNLIQNINLSFYKSFEIFILQEKYHKPNNILVLMSKIPHFKTSKR